jgi:hypothetical protein
MDQETVFSHQQHPLEKESQSLCQASLSHAQNQIRSFGTIQQVSP